MAVDSIRGAGTERVQVAGMQTSTLFREHSRMVYGLCLALLRNPADADDASQATFVSAYRALLGGTHPREPAAWLATIARNECASRVRAGMREPLPLPDTELGLAEGPEDELERRAAVEKVRLAIAQLPEKQREAVVLRDLYGLHYSEVGAALGMSVSSVESLLFRARRRLRLSLKPLAGGVLVVPVAVREGVARAVPAFSSGGSLGGAPTGGVGLGLLAKLVGAPAAVKSAAAVATAVAAGSFAVAGMPQGRAHAPAVEAGRSAVPAVAAIAGTGASPASAHRGRSAKSGHGGGAVPADRGGDGVRGRSAAAASSGGPGGNGPIGVHHGTPGSPGFGAATATAAPGGGEDRGPSGPGSFAGGPGSGGPPDDGAPDPSDRRGTRGSAPPSSSPGQQARSSGKGSRGRGRAGGAGAAVVPVGHPAERATPSGGGRRPGGAGAPPALLTRTRSAPPGQGRDTPDPDETRRNDAGPGEAGRSSGAPGDPPASGRSARDDGEPGAPGEGNSQGGGPGNGGPGEGGSQGGGPGNGGPGDGTSQGEPVAGSGAATASPAGERR